MRDARNALACVLALLFAIPVTHASAACPPGGTWHVFLMQASTPAIDTQLYNVGNADNTGAVGVIGFPNTGVPFDNATANVIKCRMTLNANGVGRTACTTYGVVAGDSYNFRADGFINLNACQITGGRINVPNDPAIIMLGGYINGVHGSGIARQGSGRVFLFNFVKEPNPG